MSGVLHPVGPEPAATYWLRRVLVLAVLAVVLVVVVALVRTANRPQQAVPAPAASGTPSVSSSAPTSSPPSEASTVPSAPNASVSATGSLSSTPLPTSRPKQAAPVPCAPTAVRISLTGVQSLKPRAPDVFHLSLVNTTGTSCRVQVSGQSFELRISSGRDRIWTTRHCPRLVPSVNQVLAGKQSVRWDVTWNGLRSAPGCRNRSEVPQVGTYVAAAKLAGVRAVRLRVAVNA